MDIDVNKEELMSYSKYVIFIFKKFLCNHQQGMHFVNKLQGKMLQFKKREKIVKYSLNQQFNSL